MPLANLKTDGLLGKGGNKQPHAIKRSALGAVLHCALYTPSLGPCTLATPRCRPWQVAHDWSMTTRPDLDSFQNSKVQPANQVSPWPDRDSWQGPYDSCAQLELDRMPGKGGAWQHMGCPAARSPVTSSACLTKALHPGSCARLCATPQGAACHPPPFAQLSGRRSRPLHSTSTQHTSTARACTWRCHCMLLLQPLQIERQASTRALSGGGAACRRCQQQQPKCAQHSPKGTKSSTKAKGRLHAPARSLQGQAGRQVGRDSSGRPLLHVSPLELMQPLLQPNPVTACRASGKVYTAVPLPIESSRPELLRPELLRSELLRAELLRLELLRPVEHKSVHPYQHGEVF